MERYGPECREEERYERKRNKTKDRKPLMSLHGIRVYFQPFSIKKAKTMDLKEAIRAYESWLFRRVLLGWSDQFGRNVLGNF
jgi:hypothetical protein